MVNIYINFSNLKDKDEFLIKILNLELTKETKNFLKNVEASGRKENPYYKMNGNFPGGLIPKGTDTSIKWQIPSLYEMGIKSIYMQKSYLRRPGNWLVIEFRNTNKASMLYEWINNNIPPEIVGDNVPLPESVILTNKLERCQTLVSSLEPYKYVHNILVDLLDVKNRNPKLFKGDFKYIFEELAMVFCIMNKMDKAIFCQEMLAELMPNDSYPYINMGLFYSSIGNTLKAKEVYKKGLEINPNDEYIFANMSSVSMYDGYSLEALKNINNAILSNPDRSLNYKILGDIHFSRHDYDIAAFSYEWALKNYDEEWKAMASDCYENLIEAYKRIGYNTKAANANKLHLAFKNGKLTTGKLYYDTGELHYEGQIKEENTPYGYGVKYYIDGTTEMEGFFGDWFIESGKEYYENGILRYNGEYNKGPRNYYGPRFFTEGKLYYDTGQLWYKGRFNIERIGSLGFPSFKEQDSFVEGIEYDKDGNVICEY